MDNAFAKVKEPFQCAECGRTFSRPDHLTRHVQSHAQDRPFRCPTCQKGFGRADLLKRHAQSHDPDETQSPKRHGRQRSTHPRASQACTACATAKLKCDEQRPCGRCQRRHIQCKYGRDNPARHNAPAEREHTPVVNLVSVEDRDAQATITPQNASSYEWSQESSVSMSGFATTGQPEGSAEDQNAMSLSIHEHQYSDFLKGLMTPLTPNASDSYDPLLWQNSELAPRNMLNFTAESNLEFSNTDFNLLNQLYEGSFDGINENRFYSESCLQQESSNNTEQSAKSVGLGADAFKKSTLSRWLPAQNDSIDTEMNGISALGNDAASPDHRPKLSRRYVHENLNQTSRDRVLAMILNSHPPERAPTIAASFPPAPLLDDLMQLFFSVHDTQISSFIHTPTFSPNIQTPELLGAIVAYGAVLTDIKPLHKLGCSIQETVRLRIPKICDHNHVAIRELWLLQAFICQLEIGLWSGNRRKMEVAEAHTQGMITMIRRARTFQKSKFAPSRPLPEDSGEVLQRKWHDWARSESFKRLAFRLLLLDAQSSMTLLVNPLISYAEVTSSLPEVRELWTAPDAEQWKEIYLSKYHQTFQAEPSLTSILRQRTEPLIIDSIHDLNFSSLIVLHAFWGMIWEYCQQSAVLNIRSSDSNAIMTLRYQDLCQFLTRVRLVIFDIGEAPCHESLIVFQVLSMYLHCSLEEIQLFAGKEDIDEARRVLPSLQQWMDGFKSRQAIWHAGQVIRAAKALPFKRLTGFYAVALYHASLVCWAYGLISQAKTGRKETSLEEIALHSTNHVILDGDDSPAVQRFIILGRGIPAIATATETNSSTTAIVPLSDPEAVMKLVADILRSNSHTASDQRIAPPMVENLIQLLQDLGIAAGHVKQTYKFPLS